MVVEGEGTWPSVEMKLPNRLKVFVFPNIFRRVTANSEESRPNFLNSCSCVDLPSLFSGVVRPVGFVLDDYNRVFVSNNSLL